MLRFELHRPIGIPQMVKCALCWKMHQPTEMVCGVEASDINDAIDRFRLMHEVRDLVTIDVGVDSADCDILIEDRFGYDMGFIKRTA